MTLLSLHRPVVRLGSLIAALLTSTALAGPSLADTAKCQGVIGSAGAKYAQARLKALSKCELAKVAGKLPSSTDCAAEEKTASTLAKALAKMEAAIGKACGGEDQVCGGDLTGETTPADAGWPSTCSNFEQAGCAGTITDCSDIATCLQCSHDQAVDQEVSLFLGSLAETNPATQANLNKCQQVFGKANAAFVQAKTKILQSCWKGRLGGKHNNPCPDPGDGKAAAKIAAAEAKRSAAICKACGGSDQLCNGVGDLTPNQVLGFSPYCPSLVDPDGDDCGALGLVNTLTKMVACSGCVSSFKAACMDRERVPQFGAYPAACAAVPMPTLLSLTVTPADSVVLTGASKQFTATAHYSDTSTQDVTADAIWSSSNPSAATISNASGTEGQATGVMVGSTTITATLGALSDMTTLTVTDTAVTYSTVQPIFQSKCTPCHTSLGSGFANFATSYSQSQLGSYYCPGHTKGYCTLVRVQEGSMPQGAGCTGNPTLDAGNPACLTAAEQSTLAQWIMQGQLP